MASVTTRSRSRLGRPFENHLLGARKIRVRDPYVRAFFQARNFMELLQGVHELVPEGDEVAVNLVTQSDMATCVTQSDMATCVKQEGNRNQLVKRFTGSRAAFSWEQAMQELRLIRGAEVNYTNVL